MAGTSPLGRLVIRDFQAHEHTVVGLDPSCTVFVGPSDCGKSAVVRALKFLCLNGVKGAGFVRHGRARASVSLTVGAHKVVRVRGKGRNAYKLDGKTFTAFGQGAVPDQIQQILNCTPDNFQGQIDPPYWFLNSPGQVSKDLNRIVSLDKIDRVLAALARKAAAKKTELELTEARLDDLTQEADRLKWAKGFSAGVARLERLKAALDSKAARAASLAFSLRKAIRAGRRRNRLQNGLLGAEKLISTGRAARESASSAARLAKLLKEAGRAADLAKADVPDLKRLTAARKNMDRASDHRGLLDLLLRDTLTARSILCGRTDQLTEAEAELKKTKTCPTCGRSWSPTSTCGTGHP